MTSTSGGARIGGYWREVNRQRLQKVKAPPIPISAETRESHEVAIRPTEAQSTVLVVQRLKYRLLKPCSLQRFNKRITLFESVETGPADDPNARTRTFSAHGK
jgi:hypothetical protein